MLIVAIFITLVLALMLELLFLHPHRLKNFSWLILWRNRLQQLWGAPAWWQGPLGVVTVLVLPVACAAIIQTTEFYQQWLLGFFGIIIGVLVLIYCLRYQGVDQAVEEMLRQDPKTPDDLRDQRLGRELFDDAVPTGPDRYEVMAQAVLVQANERLFAVLFWFVILGPMGALLYRAVWCLTRNPVSSPPELEDTFDQAATRLYGILSWAPARLTAIAYALAGGFEDAVCRWKDVPHDEEENFFAGNHRVLAAAGVGALHLERYTQSTEEEGQPVLKVEREAVRAAHALVLRALLIWSSLFAVVVLTILARG